MTRAQEWREKSRLAAKERGQKIALPSGMVIVARKPGPAVLASLGVLPMSLTASVAPAGGESQGDDVAALTTLMREVLLYTVVEPRISLTPTAEEIHPRDISDGDLNYILCWAMGREEAAGLESFRRQSANGGAGGGGKNVGGAAVRDARRA